MDLLRDYGSDDSSSDDDEEGVQLKQETKPEKPQRTNHEVKIVLSRSIPEGTFVRSVPHTPGHWSGHVFCATPQDQDAWQNSMQESVQRFRKFLTKIAYVGPLVSHLDAPIHLSLSRPFGLQLSSIESFVAKLKRRLIHLPATTLRVHPTRERILRNDDQTRSFWVWPIDNNPTLMAVLEEINAVLGDYNQPPFHDPPVFHVSLASIVGDLSLGPGPTASGKGPTLLLPVSQINCTFGTTKQYTFELSDC